MRPPRPDIRAGATPEGIGAHQTPVKRSSWKLPLTADTIAHDLRRRRRASEREPRMAGDRRRDPMDPDRRNQPPIVCMVGSRAGIFYGDQAAVVAACRKAGARYGQPSILAHTQMVAVPVESTAAVCAALELVGRVVDVIDAGGDEAA